MVAEILANNFKLKKKSERNKFKLNIFSPSYTNKVRIFERKQQISNASKHLSSARAHAHEYVTHKTVMFYVQWRPENCNRASKSRIACV